MKILPVLAFLTAVALAPFALGAESTPAAAPAKRQFLYVLRLVTRLHDDKAWTPADNEIIGRHFNRLKAATERGQVILAGRTTESGDKTMGLVIFEAADEDAAREFMNTDPAVVGNLMTATLHPYAIAVRAK
jgi:uncharacterized protein